MGLLQTITSGRRKRPARRPSPPNEEAYDYTAIFGGLALFLGAVAVAGAAGSDPGRPWLQTFAAAMTFAGAALAVGFLTGFLFGIPRMASSPDASNPTPKVGEALPAYQANTNLDQVSDWLTKILIGVGLTQIGSLGDDVRNLAGALSDGFRGDYGPFSVAVCIYFAAIGFLWGYLWSRIQVPASFRRSDVRLRQQERDLETRLAELPGDDRTELEDTTREDEPSEQLPEPQRQEILELNEQVRAVEKAGGSLDAAAHRRLAQQLRRVGDHVGAEAAYLRAAELDPTDPAPLNFAGVIRSKYRNDSRGAEDLYRQALARDPGFTSATYNWACARARLGDHDAALQLLAAATTINKKYVALARQDAEDGGPFQALRDNDTFRLITGETPRRRARTSSTAAT